MSILHVRQVIDQILTEADAAPESVTIYAAGKVPEDWADSLNNRSLLAPEWFLSSKEAIAQQNAQIFPETPGPTSVLIIATTSKINVGAKNRYGAYHLRRDVVVLVSIMSHGKQIRPDLWGKKITRLVDTSKKVDIDGIGPST